MERVGTTESLTSVEDLVKRAPENLQRTGGPDFFIITDPEQMRESSDSWRKLGSKGQELVAEVQKRFQEGELKIATIPAKELLEAALSIPKDVHETHGAWYTDTVSGFVDWLIQRKYGAHLFHEAYSFDSPLTRIHWRSEQWRINVATSMESGRLWEMGAIIRGQDDNFTFASISFPYSYRYRGWHEKLTPRPIFVGREDILHTMTVMITGKTPEELQFESIMNATNEDIWWGETVAQNKIVPGSYEEIRQKIGQPFSKRILQKLDSQFSGKEGNAVFRKAKAIYPYYIEASRVDIGARQKLISLTLHLDSENWIAPFTKRAEPDFQPGTFDYKKKHKPPPYLMWDGGGRVLRNAEAEFHQKAGLAAVIVLPENAKEKKLVDSIEIEVDDFDRNVAYHINNPAVGDAFSRATDQWFLSKKRSVPMRKEGFENALKLFDKAVARAKVDTDTYWKTGKQEGITQENQRIIEAARNILKRKILAFK